MRGKEEKIDNILTIKTRYTRMGQRLTLNFECYINTRTHAYIAWFEQMYI